MKIENISLNLAWENSIKLKNLRQFILNKLSQKGEIIRWSIYEIQESPSEDNIKLIKVHAVIAK